MCDSIEIKEKFKDKPNSYQIRKIWQDSGLDTASFGELLEIPNGTIVGWVYGRREAPIYVLKYIKMQYKKIKRNNVYEVKRSAKAVAK